MAIGVIQVYHNKNFLDAKYSLNLFQRQEDEIVEVPADDLVMVGWAYTDNLEKAFELTNSIEYHWSEGKEVYAKNLRARSTSVGDVMKLKGKYYIVMPVGFNEAELV